MLTKALSKRQNIPKVALDLKTVSLYSQILVIIVFSILLNLGPFPFEIINMVIWSPLTAHYAVSFGELNILESLATGSVT
jgi:hypothetical protein